MKMWKPQARCNGINNFKFQIFNNLAVLLVFIYCVYKPLKKKEFPFRKLDMRQHSLRGMPIIITVCQLWHDGVTVVT